MRTPVVRSTLPLALLVLALAAPVARGQQEEGGMGLDLSGTETPESSDESSESAEEAPQPGSIGLDLSAEVSSGQELLPRLVLLGLETPERAGAAVATRWLRALYGAVRGSGQVVLGASLPEARERLAEGYEAALRCGEASCMTEPAESLEADLLVTARLSLEDEGWMLRLWTFDRDRNVVETDSLKGRSPRDARFQQAGARLLAQRIQALARPRSLLKVNVNVPQAVVRVGERTLGVGSLEARVPPGEVTLTVDADEYTTFTRTLTLQPGETSSVDVYLESVGPAPEGPSDDAVAAVRKKREGPSGPSIFTRPALYTALVGLAAVGAGVLVGGQAQKVADRATDANGDGIIDITRRERIDAQSQANLATALMAGGGAVAAGSVVWLVLVPTRSEPPPVAPAATPTGATSSPTTALHLILGGSF